MYATVPRSKTPSYCFGAITKDNSRSTMLVRRMTSRTDEPLAICVNYLGHYFITDTTSFVSKQVEARELFRKYERVVADSDGMLAAAMDYLHMLYDGNGLNLMAQTVKDYTQRGIWGAFVVQPSASEVADAVYELICMNSRSLFRYLDHDYLKEGISDVFGDDVFGPKDAVQFLSAYRLADWDGYMMILDDIYDQLPMSAEQNGG